MSSVVAIVKSIVGQVIALTPEGTQRVLIEGDRLFKGEQLVTAPESMVSLELTDGRIVDLGRDTQWSSAELDEQAPAAQQPAIPSAAELQQAIAAGVDPTQALAPTAAGPGGAGGAGGGAVGGGHSFVILEATAGQVSPELGFTTPALGEGAQGLQQDNSSDSTTNSNFAPFFTGTNSAPLGVDQSTVTDEDTPLTGTFTARDPNGDPLTFSQLNAPQNGSLTLTQGGQWTYTPNPNYNGPDSFQVQVSDGRGGSDTLTVNVGVTPANDAPVAVETSAATVEDGSLVTGQLDASDIDADTLLSFSLNQAPPAGFSLNSDGNWTFDPSNVAYQALAEGEVQIINVPFTVTDEHGATSGSSLTLTLTGTNDAPVISTATAAASEGAAVI
ncbi:MAG: retention module-containing protein, partial [Pseudomonas sp.]